MLNDWDQSIQILEELSRVFFFTIESSVMLHLHTYHSCKHTLTAKCTQTRERDTDKLLSFAVVKGEAVESQRLRSLTTLLLVGKKLLQPMIIHALIRHRAGYRLGHMEYWSTYEIDYHSLGSNWPRRWACSKYAWEWSYVVKLNAYL